MRNELSLHMLLPEPDVVLVRGGDRDFWAARAHDQGAHRLGSVSKGAEAPSGVRVPHTDHAA